MAGLLFWKKRRKRKKEKKKKKKCLRLDPKESGEVSIGEEGEGRSFRVERPKTEKPHGNQE